MSVDSRSGRGLLTGDVFIHSGSPAGDGGADAVDAEAEGSVELGGLLGGAGVEAGEQGGDVGFVDVGGGGGVTVGEREAEALAGGGVGAQQAEGEAEGAVGGEGEGGGEVVGDGVNGCGTGNCCIGRGTGGCRGGSGKGLVDAALVAETVEGGLEGTDGGGVQSLEEADDEDFTGQGVEGEVGDGGGVSGDVDGGGGTADGGQADEGAVGCGADAEEAAAGFSFVSAYSFVSACGLGSAIGQGACGHHFQGVGQGFAGGVADDGDSVVSCFDVDGGGGLQGVGGAGGGGEDGVAGVALGQFIDDDDGLTGVLDGDAIGVEAGVVVFVGVLAAA